MSPQKAETGMSMVHRNDAALGRPARANKLYNSRNPFAPKVGALGTDFAQPASRKQPQARNPQARSEQKTIFPCTACGGAGSGVWDSAEALAAHQFHIWTDVTDGNLIESW